VADSFQLLSGSTQGKGIKVTGTATGSSVTIHTAVSGTTDIDLVTLWAQNNDADAETRVLTIEWGGTADPDNLIILSVPCKAGPVMICDRMPLHNGLVIKAWADEANDVQIYGLVTRLDY
jgi:hypothetical protein